MFNVSRLRTVLVAFVVAVTAFTAVASAQAGSRIPKVAGKAETKVNIKGDNGDYYGYVKSIDADNCANGRKVKVFKQLGSSQDPKHDLKIGTDYAQPNGDKYMWSIGNSGYKHGKFYAKVGKTDYCKGDTSKTIDR
jgi:maltose-binding protein MalE